tara:strand:+ start:298 stop:513 length:216 start_codon:yes stop_codon:yes gene_type:complete
MSNVSFSTLNKSFDTIAYPFTNIVLGALLFGTATIRVLNPTAPILTRVRMPVAPLITRVTAPADPVYTRIM